MKAHSNTFLLLSATILVAAGLLQGLPEALLPSATRDGPVVVPFRVLPSNHMVVEAKLNGKGPYRFIFDLGAPVTLLTHTAAQESGAIEKNAAKPFFLAARGDVQLNRLELGSLVAKDVPVIVMDHPALKALGGIFNRPLSGIIGYTFWARYRMTIDYQAKQLTFTPVDFEVQDLFKELPARLTGPKRAKTIVLAPRGVWGMSLAETPESADTGGVSVQNVVDGSPADAAGLKAGDVLLSLDGRWTASVADAYAAAEKVQPGQSAGVIVIRQEKEITLNVTPREGL